MAAKSARVESNGEAWTVVKMTTVELDRNVEVGVLLRVASTTIDDDCGLKEINIPSLAMVLDGVLDVCDGDTEEDDRAV